MKKLILVIMILTLLFGIGLAKELKGVKMSDTITVDGKNLVLNGLALRKKVIFKVYVAGLYLEKKSISGEEILNSEETKRLVMHFLRKVGRKKINNAWYDGLKDNTPGYSPDLKKKFDDLAGMMEDMRDEGLIVFTYVHDKGTQIMINGKVKGSIMGKDFMSALFACWIGPEPGPGEGFKEDLLGK
jgi:hypothetical protein